LASTEIWCLGRIVKANLGPADLSVGKAMDERHEDQKVDAFSERIAKIKPFGVYKDRKKIVDDYGVRTEADGEKSPQGR